MLDLVRVVLVAAFILGCVMLYPAVFPKAQSLASIQAFGRLAPPSPWPGVVVLSVSLAGFLTLVLRRRDD